MTDLIAALAGRYTIERELGSGGMATIYLAHDVRHGRKVALKVLRPELAAIIGAARFLAEIRTTANLQHPHILPLYDSGEVKDGTTGAGTSSVFYVMPYVAGESLRDRLRREKQLPLDDAVRIAAEVADALDYAHRHGVVHRDIKPENILLHDGRVLVADFGIALAATRAEGGTRLTETGLSLGTPHYMSPEQAMGEREITPRSDVYALGCVLYEMLVGEPPFTGPTPQAIVARVMTDAPRSLVAQRHTVPLHVDAAVRRALEKLPADRFATAAQFAEALTNPATVAHSIATPTDAAVSATNLYRRARLVPPLGAIALAGLALAAWGWLRPEPVARVSRYAISFPPEQTPNGLMSLSRNGNRLVYTTFDASAIVPGNPLALAQLWLKERNRADPVPIPGTINAFSSFAISPDEASLAIVSPGATGDQGALKRMPIAGGVAITLADSAFPTGVAWLDDGTLIFSRATRQGTAFGTELWRVAENGGPASLIWRPDSGVLLALPTPLPNGRGVLVTLVRGPARTGGFGTAQSAWAIDTRSGAAKEIIQGALAATYVPTGHLLYARTDGALLAVPFDLGSLQVRGAAIPVLGGVELLGGLLPQFTVAMDGTLMLRLVNGGSAANFRAVWVDRRGIESPIDSAWRFNPVALGYNTGWALSPDGTRLALGLTDGTNDDIWVKELPRGPLTRITFDPASEFRPRWTPDGKAITYIGMIGGTRTRLLQRNADGSGSPTVLMESEPGPVEGAWSTDRRWLLARVGDATTSSREILGRQIGVETAMRPLVASRSFLVSAFALSSDGKWLAYESNEAGASEVFIRPFPNTESAKWQVSTNGGFAPLWNRNSRELFYVTPRREMVAVSVGAGTSPQFGERKVLFTMSNDLYGGVDEYYTPHDISPDGSRFIMARRARSDSATTTRLLVVENFFEELKARARRP